ncbi:MAG: glycosyltransferase family 39 protein, partial [Tannerella sp.]|nr:glycosyltransferase family 39 protein [Tannerella sp.]
MRTSALQYLYLQKPVTTVIVICAVALLPWLGSDFYTKGEPREASVAVSMLKSGNGILPEVYAGEFAYKPPMAHWLMAACSLPQGRVTEFTSRLPSALAQIVLAGFVLAFFGKRIRFEEAFVATLLLATAFEIHRAGMTARVDMLLTTFTVLGLMQLYRWENRLELKGLPIAIPLLLSCAVLTKGPVGIVLPLFVFFVHLLLLRRYRFRKILKALLYTGLSSAFIPLLWYAAAWRQGGDGFMDVVLAENFGRFFHLSESSISYDLGHEEGVFYNAVTLLAGFVPWTLLLVLSLFGAGWRRPRVPAVHVLKDAWKRFQSMEEMKRFSLVAAVCIIFFYTIPSSKRSVYLMPAYPFLAVLLAQYFVHVTKNRAKVTRIFTCALTVVASAAFVAGLLVMTQAVDPTAVAARFTTREATLNAAGSIAATLAPGNLAGLTVMLLLAASIVTVVRHMMKRINIKILYAVIFMTFSINLFIDGIVMKSVKNDSSSRPFAEQIVREYRPEGNIFVMNNPREYLNLYGMN